MPGAYKIPLYEGAATGGYTSTAYTLMTFGKFDATVDIKGVEIMAGSALNGVSGRAVLYDSVKNVVAKGTLAAIPPTSTGAWVELSFDVPVRLAANANYYIGVYMSSALTSYTSGGSTTPRTIGSSPSGGANFIEADGDMWSATGDSAPQYQSTGYEFGSRLVFDSVPVVSITYPTAATQFDPIYPLQVTWSLNTGTPTQYEIGYSVAGANTWTTVTATSTNLYHDYAPGTFTISQSYDFRVRMFVNGAWTGYSTATILAEPPWVYGPEITTSSTSSQPLPSNLIANSTFDVDISGWESNSVFGNYTPGTLSRITANPTPHSGAGALQFTYPGGGRSLVNTFYSGLTIGETYRLSSWIYIPPGGPDVYLDIVFRTSGPVVTTKGSWVQTEHVYKTDTTDLFVGFTSVTAPAAGQYIVIDDFTLTHVLRGQDYQIQIKTADTVGYGPWGAGTLVVKPNTTVRQNGRNVVGKKFQMNGGKWLESKDVKTRTGGTFT